VIQSSSIGTHIHTWQLVAISCFPRVTNEEDRRIGRCSQYRNHLRRNTEASSQFLPCRGNRDTSECMTFHLFPWIQHNQGRSVRWMEMWEQLQLTGVGGRHQPGLLRGIIFASRYCRGRTRGHLCFETNWSKKNHYELISHENSNSN
jgi:hypothetical protein